MNAQKTTKVTRSKMMIPEKSETLLKIGGIVFQSSDFIDRAETDKLIQNQKDHSNPQPMIDMVSQ